MIAFKGFNQDLTCRGFQFRENEINRTEQANCRENGFHCAENPLDCLNYYGNWRQSVYYEVEAFGDLDEDALDSKISCTEMKLIKRLSIQELLFKGMVYMVKYPKRDWNSYVKKEEGKAVNGFAVVRGKSPRACGDIGSHLAILKEDEGRQNISEVALFTIDGEKYKPDTWYDVYCAEKGRCA